MSKSRPVVVSTDSAIRKLILTTFFVLFFFCYFALSWEFQASAAAHVKEKIQRKRRGYENNIRLH
jgi:hypothetical protein